jgi:hypothetical protein
LFAEFFELIEFIGFVEFLEFLWFDVPPKKDTIGKKDEKQSN